MNPVLENELAPPSFVVIAGKRCRLGFPLHAVILYKQLTGDSLFNPENWKSIDLQQDPKRWVSCLWAGLHEQQPDKTWKAPFTVDELEGEVHFGNAGDISVEMVKALVAYMPKKSAEAPDPNEPAPAEKIQPAKTVEDLPNPTTVSDASGYSGE